MTTVEARRLSDDAHQGHAWKHWGPYLAERQWGTVREDYSATGECWTYFPHDHARSRAYRWGEDGLLGICDNECRLCFAIALWNGRDPILKERLFGLSGPEGNHGEDVKECYFYLDATPTHSYLKALYRYPQAAFPYARLVEENARRGKEQPEFELLDTGVFDDGRFFDVTAEYAKVAPDDIAIRITVANRGSAEATLHVLPQLWFRNTWSWGRQSDGYWPKPEITRGARGLTASHVALGSYLLEAEPGPDGATPTAMFTENESHFERLFGTRSPSPYVKDAFHRFVVEGEDAAINPEAVGTKAALHYVLRVPAGAEQSLHLRLCTASAALHPSLREACATILTQRRAEADEFYEARTPPAATVEETRALRLGYAGLLWSEQFYHYVVQQWLEGDPSQPPPPEQRWLGRNTDWRHVFSRDVLSMPDKWEYPWFAAWDLAFHVLPLGGLDPEFAKHQMLLLLREWYTHPNGQLPAYEFAFGDVNPPVHAWACWRLYKTTAARGARDRVFLERAFHKLLINFTWWVNRKDIEGNNLFAGGFLGLDNVGVFDRSQPLPGGGVLEQADGTAWMAFYCLTMLAMALELASEDSAYEDVASKFFEHFVAINDAMNSMGEAGLWDEQDGFYYDELHVNGHCIPLRIRSGVGIIPLFACETLSEHVMRRLPGFAKRTNWFLQNRPELARHISTTTRLGEATVSQRLLSIAPREYLVRVLQYVLDEREFLSPYGIRSMSRVHAQHPFVFRSNGAEYSVDYEPAESRTGLFGGNSNWRGPIWLPINYLLIEALERYHHFYGDELRVEYPTGSGNYATLLDISRDLSRRIASLFLPDEHGRRPVHGDDPRWTSDPNWREHILFYEYFDGDTGRGLGASHQTGWTALVVRLIEDLARARGAKGAGRHREALNPIAPTPIHG